MCDLKGILLCVLCCLVPLTVSAGDLDAPAGPSDAGSAMFTLEDIYNRLVSGAAGAKRTGAFTEPASGPGVMGHTLDEVMAAAPRVDDTAGAGEADVLDGKTFWGLTGGAWGPRTGTMTNVGQETITPTTTNQTITKGYHDGTGYAEGDGDLLQGNIKEGVDLFGVTGTFPSDGTAVAGEVKSGSTFYTSSANKLTGTGTKTLSADSNTVSEGYYEETTLSAVDPDLVAANIKCGVTIFGVTGYGCVVKTGQTTSYASGDDGAYQKGCYPEVLPSWAFQFEDYNRRSFGCSAGFTDNGDGTVTDNLTGLIWLKDANCFGSRNWTQALSDCNTLASGSCGLTDGSSAGDWRLPNFNEFRSLFDPNLSAPYLPAGHPFTGVQSFWYWSSTTPGSTDVALGMELNHGDTMGISKSHSSWYVWPVRGGQ